MGTAQASKVADKKCINFMVFRFPLLSDNWR
jgi:hypothetical protein